MVYLEGDNPDHLAMFVPHQAQSEVPIIDSLILPRFSKSSYLAFMQICVYDALDVHSTVFV